MKSILKLIKLYQNYPTKLHGLCRHYPTCSVYMHDAIIEHGTTKGITLGIWRIMRCNPFSRKLYDPVPKKRRKI